MAARTSLVVVVALAFVVATGVPGCSSPGDDAAEIAPTPTASVPEIPHGKPVLDLSATAFDNKAFFDSILRPVAKDTSSPSRDMVNALVDAGFDKRLMQVTGDKTKTGLDADSVIVSVELRDLCLIGQRTSSGDYYSTVEPALESGGCLIGDTEKIDW